MSGENHTNTIGIAEVFGDSTDRASRLPRPARSVKEAARETPVLAETDVLVVGGGPAGTAAAIAAGRLGAEAMLVERYNHLGGLSTGGLVIWIDRMSDWNGKQVIAGLAGDFLDRLPDDAVKGPERSDWGSADVATAAYWAQRTAAFHGITTWSPTVDPEALKTLSMQMTLEQKVRLLFHAYAVEPIVEDGAMRGAIFESKEGRHAVLAKVVIDTTGDADLLARAGLSFETDSDPTDIHSCINTAFMIGGVDMNRWIDFKTGDGQGFKDFMARGRERLKYFERPFVSWRNDIALFMGPRLAGYSAVDVEDLSEIEIRSRQLTMGHLETYKEHAPGFENAFLMLGAPQIGVRHSRRLLGENKVVRGQWDDGTVWDNEIGVSTSLAPKFPNISVPYGALVPVGLDGVLAAGRHVACDTNSHSFLREIPQCWLTGQAAGVAAALSADAGVAPRALDPRLIQRELLRQGAYLSPSIEAAADASTRAAE
ncbi:MAG: FAD-dependent oxidoreductase [Alphaproteobacteria bacterium]|nr:FAD-dependent oxidoreductase [Alphaproteobacteria bacterium]